ncbi:MAG: cytochrome-c peroxidase [Mariprofundaceae bacterium]|nr:cytochrome-c peroxidase [Mariprofundaceae bacterium]
MRCFILFLCLWSTPVHANDMSGVDPLALMAELTSSTQDRPALIELGKKLFFDPILSANNEISCATCHDPLQGWADGMALGIGVTGQRLKRHTPSFFNIAYQTRWFWDGLFV